MIRKPAWAGRFYPDDPQELTNEVGRYLEAAKPESKQTTMMAMVPHAGYMFSGGVAGKTIGASNFTDTVLLLGPNHTGVGRTFSVWADGEWETPSGSLQVDSELASALMEADSRVVSNTNAHRAEHSLEVMIPFLHAKNSSASVVPIAVAEPSLSILTEVGTAIANVISSLGRPVTMLVSSDMSHMIDADKARKLDFMAIEQIEKMDPEGLFRTVRDNQISMCGILPMTVGLTAANALGATKATLVEYANSGDTLGDYSEVVGYAGMIVE